MDRRRFATRTPAVALAAAALALIGCLEEPEIDERWTLLETLSASPRPGATVDGTQPVEVTVRGRVTWRRILTGFLVAEVRYSDTISPSSVNLTTSDHTLAIAQGVDRILANSVTAGRATRPVTGWDHLMQDVELSFTALVPPEMLQLNRTGGLYLLLYLGSGEEIRRNDGTDSLVVTPFVSTDQEVLHTGFALDVAPPGGAQP